MRLPPAGLLDELAKEFILQLWVGQTHLQGTLGKRDMVVDSWGINGHIDEKLTSLRRCDVKSYIQCPANSKVS